MMKKLVAMLLMLVLCMELAVTASAAASYTVTIASGIENGIVTVDKTEAEMGDTVTLTAVPANGYALSEYTVTDANDNPVTVTNGVFTMPESNVTVTAAFNISSRSIIFYANNGTDQTYVLNKSTTSSLPTAEECGFTAPEGKVLKGWALNSVTGKMKLPGRQNYNINGGSALYAIWTDPVASVTIGGTTTIYGNLIHAFSAADGKTATITLLSDWDNSLFAEHPQIKLSASKVTFDLNGHKISNSNSSESNALEFNGECVIKNGEIEFTGGGQYIRFYSSAKNSKLTINGDVKITNTNPYGNAVLVSGGANTVIVESGAEIAVPNKSNSDKTGAITLYKDATLIVNGGTISSSGSKDTDIAAYSTSNTNTTVVVNGGSFDTVKADNVYFNVNHAAVVTANSTGNAWYKLTNGISAEVAAVTYGTNTTTYDDNVYGLSGTNAVVTVTPATGYAVKTVKANDTAATKAENDYTFAMPKALVTLTAEAENAAPDSYTVTLPSGTGYTATAVEGSSATVDKGGSYSFTVTISDGYRKGSGFAVKANDAPLTEQDGKYTITNINENQIVTVEGVEEIPSYTVTVSAAPTEGGTVTNGGSYEEGASVTLTATANEGYAFVNWTENGQVVSTDASYTFTVTGDRNLVANFEELPPSEFTVTYKVGDTVVYTDEYEAGEAIIHPDRDSFRNIPENYYGVRVPGDAPAVMPAEDTVIECQWTVTLTLLDENDNEKPIILSFINNDVVKLRDYVYEAVLNDEIYANYYGTYHKEGHEFWLVNVDDPTERYTVMFESGSPIWPMVPMDQSKTLKATFVKKAYTVIWQNWDGTELEKDEDVDYGTTPTYNGETPTKAADAQNTYTFAGWDPAVAPVTGETIYTAQFSSSVNSYTISWDTDGDGDVDDTTTVAYGEMPTHADGSKPADTQYTYTFTGWSPALAAVTGEATYTAQFSNGVNSYTISWDTDGDGDVDDTTTVAYGEMPTHADGSKPADSQYTYTFTGWSPALAAVTGEATYTAQFSSSVNSYTISWDTDGDGDVDDTTTVAYGEMPTHADGSKPADSQYTYTFTGWSPALAAVTGEATYTAQFSNGVNSYTISWDTDGDGEVDDTTTVAYGEMPTHADGSKPADSQYTYTFTGWSPALAAVTGEATYTAQFSNGVNSYTISWDTDGDGDVDDTTTVAYGEMPTHADGSKPADTQYTYTFTGWSPALATVTGEAAYTAQFSNGVNSYTISWDTDGDGDVDDTTTVAYGEMPTHADGSKPADTQHTYTFTGWSPALAAVTGEATYTAQFSNGVNSYTISWDTDGDGDVDDTTTVAYGEMPTHADGSKPADTQYTYTFTGWSPALAAVTGEVTYTATFTSSTNAYTVIWQNWDGTELEKDENVLYGTTPSYDGAVPTKAGTAETTYTFAGWNPVVAPVTGDVTYKATFTSSTNAYTVIWQNEDGTELEKDENVPYGTTPSYDGAVPTKAGDAQYTYTFASWTPAVSAATGNVTYTATYNRHAIPVIVSPTTGQTITVYEGEQATMSIVAEHAVSYQWKVSDDGGRNWYNRGENSPTYVSSPAKLDNDGYIYKCVVTGENGKKVESPIFTLEVLEKIDIPQTGDNSQIGLWTAMCLLSMAGILLLRKKAYSR